ncbi:hypothetical protein CSC74_15395 [Pseudoxanthomonas yeongjuensis]|jgi:hypothetical protein|uniref:hypothetical protein n=1 Tax=Pseudoxanthomonas yeongjuensis TaxID=377616 RepID=UPI001390B7CE|nr:hypothetical protein [Pseudoxanthomonas yeongjuensis]KAF1714633.1 hypothetical protein CSC74_15395 [Pseudoxanthomonas yeongjuensis]
MPRSFRSSLLIAFLTLSSSAGAMAQPAEAQYLPRSGDAWIDRQLADINVYAARYPQSFADEMARYYSVPRDYVEAMLQQPTWEAGDILMACALAQVVGQPCRAVVREWSREHAEGWAGVARRLQAKPGSAQYRELRKDIEATYSRWARPLKK